MYQNEWSNKLFGKMFGTKSLDLSFWSSKFFSFWWRSCWFSRASGAGQLKQNYENQLKDGWFVEVGWFAASKSKNRRCSVSGTPRLLRKSVFWWEICFFWAISRLLGLDKRFRYNISRDHLDREVFSKHSEAFSSRPGVFQLDQPDSDRPPWCWFVVPTPGGGLFHTLPRVECGPGYPGVKVLGQEEHRKS